MMRARRHGRQDQPLQITVQLRAGGQRGRTGTRLDGVVQPDRFGGVLRVDPPDRRADLGGETHGVEGAAAAFRRLAVPDGDQQVAVAHDEPADGFVGARFVVDTIVWPVARTVQFQPILAGPGEHAAELLDAGVGVEILLILHLCERHRHGEFVVVVRRLRREPIGSLSEGRDEAEYRAHCAVRFLRISRARRLRGCELLGFLPDEAQDFGHLLTQPR
jgi:hypothetical protein